MLNRRISDETTRFAFPNLPAPVCPGLQPAVCKPATSAGPLEHPSHPTNFFTGTHLHSAPIIQPNDQRLNRSAPQPHTGFPANRNTNRGRLNGTIQPLRSHSGASK